MIEIPESHTLASQLQKTTLGKRIESVVAAKSPHRFAFYNGDSAEYNSLLSGCRVNRVFAQAGYIEIDCGDITLLLSEGINLRFLEAGSVEPKKHQLYLVFDDSSALAATTSMYGAYMAYPSGTYDNAYYKVAANAVSPLSEGFTPSYFGGLLTSVATKLSAKAFFATEQRIPGLGNGCLQDILFTARINPRRKMNTVSDKQFETLYHAVKDKLSEMTEKGGRDTEKDLFGNSGGYRTILSKATADTPCPVCGNTIIKQQYLGGSVYYCPGCQPI